MYVAQILSIHIFFPRLSYVFLCNPNDDEDEQFFPSFYN
jgi:hypothetical protein